MDNLFEDLMTLRYIVKNQSRIIDEFKSGKRYIKQFEKKVSNILERWKKSSPPDNPSPKTEKTTEASLKDGMA